MKITPAAPELWESFYESAPIASYYQSPCWSDLWNRYTCGRYRPSPLLAERDDGARFLFPLTRQHMAGGLGIMWHGSPGGTYGGWLSDEIVLKAEESESLLKALFSYCGSISWRWFPFGPSSGTFSGQHLRNDITHVLDLTPYHRDPDSLFRNRKNLLRHKRKAERSGITVRQAETKADWVRYHQLYRQSVLRWDPPPSHVFGSSFFKLLSEEMHGVQLWLAEKEDVLAAGVVLLSGRGHISYWHGASDPLFYSMRAMNLLMHCVITDAAGQGHKYFDFNPSAGLKGVEAFKKSFGAVAMDTPVWEKSSGIVSFCHNIHRLRRRLARRRSV